MQGAEKGQAVNLDGRVMHVGIVQARFNDALTGQMAKICIEELIAMGVEADNIRHVTVPGGGHQELDRTRKDRKSVV